MKKRSKNFVILISLIILVTSVLPAQAALIGAVGPNSTAGVGPSIIAAPGDILDDCVTNKGEQGFNEAQRVTTTIDHAVDGGGIIPAGTTVDSHMIFLNSPGSTEIWHHSKWTFDAPIIGVMSDINGALEAASTFELGALGTNYSSVPIFPLVTPCGTSDASGEKAAPYGARGMEGDDSYIVSGNSIYVDMYVTEPGDWIRVLTKPKEQLCIDVDIDIKPWSDPNAFNTKRKGVIAVAILTTDNFDATNVDASTVTFGSGDAGMVHKNAHLEDVDLDGDTDMVLHFRNQETGIKVGDTEACIHGTTLDGALFEGCDSVRVVR